MWPRLWKIACYLGELYGGLCATVVSVAICMGIMGGGPGPAGLRRRRRPPHHGWCGSNGGIRSLLPWAPSPALKSHLGSSRKRQFLYFRKRESAALWYNLSLYKGGKSAGDVGPGTGTGRGTRSRPSRNVMFFLELGPTLHTNWRLSLTII